MGSRPPSWLPPLSKFSEMRIRPVLLDLRATPKLAPLRVDCTQNYLEHLLRCIHPATTSRQLCPVSLRATPRLAPRGVNCTQALPVEDQHRSVKRQPSSVDLRATPRLAPIGVNCTQLCLKQVAPFGECFAAWRPVSGARIIDSAEIGSAEWGGVSLWSSHELCRGVADNAVRCTRMKYSGYGPPTDDGDIISRGIAGIIRSLAAGLVCI